MEEKKLLTSQACRQTEYDISLEGKVVVLSAAVLHEAHRSDILGIAKPGILMDHVRFQLS